MATTLVALMIALAAMRPSTGQALRPPPSRAPPAPLDPEIMISTNMEGSSRAYTEAGLHQLIEDNLKPDLEPWLPSSRPKGALTTLDFLDLLHEIDTQWPEYRRNFVAVVVIRSNRFHWWTYPSARKWCKDRVQYAADEFAKAIASHQLAFPDVMFLMNGYDKPLCRAGNCSAPVFSFGKCWQPAMPSVLCHVDAPGVGNLRKRPGSAAASQSKSLSSARTAGGARQPLATSLLGSRARSSARGAGGAGEGPWGSSAGGGASAGNLPLSIFQRLQQMFAQKLGWPGSTLDPADKNVDSMRRRGGSSEITEGHEHEAEEAVGEGRRARAMQALPKSSSTGREAGIPTASSLQPNSPYDDILFPVMNHPFDQIISYPWAKKRDVAFMRAGVYAAMASNCSRVTVAKLAQRLEAHKWLDVGIYKNRHLRVQVKTVEQVPMETHAQYRFLLNTDGQAASWRFAKLLAIDSVILKWRSGNIEYYYRSLQAGQHFLDVDQTDLLLVVKRLAGNASAQDELRAMVHRSQQFAHRYLSQLSRSAYARAALAGYKGLFKQGQMDVLLKAVSAGEAPSMDVLLRLREKLRASKRIG